MVASAIADSGDLEHFLLEAQRGSEQERLFLLSPRASRMVAVMRKRLLTQHYRNTRETASSGLLYTIWEKKLETILSVNTLRLRSGARQFRDALFP